MAEFSIWYFVDYLQNAALLALCAYAVFNERRWGRRAEAERTERIVRRVMRGVGK